MRAEVILLYGNIAGITRSFYAQASKKIVKNGNFKMIPALVYRLMELIDGERGPALIPYKLAQGIKLFCLKFIH